MARHISPRAFATVVFVLLPTVDPLAQVRAGLSGIDTAKPRAILGATSEGEIVHDNVKAARQPTPTTMRPGTPVAHLLATSPRPTDPLDTLVARPPVLKSAQCLVDFSDYDALDRLTYAPDGFPLYAEDGHAWSPWWFQACNGIDHAVVRPIAPYEHFHLAYEDPAIQPCYPSVIDWDIIHDDGTCEEFDPRTKPRRLVSHDGNAVIHLYLYDGWGKKLFGLDGLRVVSENPVRLCYKPMQEEDGPWETSGPDGTTAPGIWLCWNSLGTGRWDLSGFGGYITEVKISSAGSIGSVSIDDLKLRVY